MIKIPQVNNYKKYMLTNIGVEVEYLNGRTKILIANSTLLKRFEDNNIQLSASGEVIENNKKKVTNTNASKKKDTASKAIKSKTTPKPRAKKSPARKAKS